MLESSTLLSTQMAATSLASCSLMIVPLPLPQLLLDLCNPSISLAVLRMEVVLAKSLSHTTIHQPRTAFSRSFIPSKEAALLKIMPEISVTMLHPLTRTPTASLCQLIFPPAKQFLPGHGSIKSVTARCT